jgi:predicted dehydrogenase
MTNRDISNLESPTPDAGRRTPDPGPFKIGIVGLGGHGGSIQRSAENTDAIEVAVVCDTNDEEVQKSKRRFNCEGVNDYADVLRFDGLDAVVLVTPNHLHLEQTLAAFDKGLDVFVEKPIANTVDDAVKMAAAAREAGVKFVVGHNMRYSRAYWRMRELVQEGRLGDIISTEIHFSADNTRWMPKDVWRLRPELCPLLPVMQLGIHGIDLVQSMVGRIQEVSAMGGSYTTQPGVIDGLVAAVRFENGRLGTLVSNYCTQVAFDFRLSGTEGTIFSTPHRGWFRKATDANSQGEGPKERFDFLSYDGESYTLQMQAFADVLAGKDFTGASVSDAISALAVVEALHQSVEHGKPVHVAAID